MKNEMCNKTFKTKCVFFFAHTMLRITGLMHSTGLFPTIYKAN